MFDEPIASFAQSATAPAVPTASPREPGDAHAEPTASFAQSAARAAEPTASRREPGDAHAEPSLAPGEFTTARALLFAYDVFIFASTLLAQSETQQAHRSSARGQRSSGRVEPFRYDDPPTGEPAVPTASLRDPGAAHAAPCIASRWFTTARGFISSKHALRGVQSA